MNNKPTWYLTHSTSFDYKSNLYLPLKQSDLVNHVDLILPHDDKDEPYDSNKWIDQSEIILAEVSYPSTGQGIELGWANKMNKNIVCFYKAGSNPSRSLKYISNDIYEYNNMDDLVKYLEKFIDQKV